MPLAQVGEELEGCLKCLGAAPGAGYDMISHKGFIAQGKIAHVMNGLFLLGVCWRQPRKSINYLYSCSKAPIISQLDMLNIMPRFKNSQIFHAVDVFQKAIADQPQEVADQRQGRFTLSVFCDFMIGLSFKELSKYEHGVLHHLFFQLFWIDSFTQLCVSISWLIQMACMIPQQIVLYRISFKRLDWNAAFFLVAQSVRLGRLVQSIIKKCRI